MKSFLLNAAKIAEKRFLHSFSRSMATQTDSAKEIQLDGGGDFNENSVLKTENFKRSWKNTKPVIYEPSALGITAVLFNKKMRSNTNNVSQNGIETEKSNSKSPAPEQNKKLRDYFFDKMKHDYQTSNEKLLSIQERLNQFFDTIHKDKDVNDAMQIVADTDTVEHIFLYGEESSDEMQTGGYDKTNKSIYIFNAKNLEENEILATLVHECGHAVQAAAEQSLEVYDNPFINGSIIAEAREDLRWPTNSDKKDDFESEIDPYPVNEHSGEVHSRVLERRVFQPQLTDEIMPKTSNEISRFQSKLKSIIEQKPKSHEKSVSVNTQEEKLFIAM